MSLEPVAARDLPLSRVVAPARATTLFHNQFFLGPECPEPLLDWPGLAVAGTLWLAAHPQLSITRVVGSRAGLTLIGFMLDPDDPVADDRIILSRLLDCCDSIDEIVRATAVLGGRWLLILERGCEAYLLTDALGLRQALYTQSADAGSVCVMSQAGLAEELLGLAMDERAAAFLDSYAVRTQLPEYYWPGMSTPLRGLHQLLPNHVLNLRTREVRRYWPDGPLPAVSIEQAVERMARIMTGLMCAAASRFELALSVTAGIDSRLMLAAARPIQHEVSYATVRQAKMVDDSADVQVPARLLARLGLAHDVIRAPGSMSADFSWTFKRNVFLAHDHYGPDAEAILARFGRQKVAVTGSGAEVGRGAPRADMAFADWHRIKARELAWVEGMRHPFAIDCFQEWLDDVGDRGYVKFLDLFEWEQGAGKWLAATQLEFDTVWRDILTPYNCRALLITMLGVDERYRQGQDCALFRASAERMWPEVMHEPVNPHKRISRLGRLKTSLARGARSYFAAR